MIDFELTGEQLAWQRIARDFSEQEIHPIAGKLDRSENLLADFPWEMIKKGSKLGLRTLSLPKEYGGPDLDMLAWLVIIDELGYADISCAKIFSQCWKLSRAIVNAGTKEQKDRFLPVFRDDDTFLLTGAQTEPESGSDSHLPYDAPNAGVRLSAQRVGDHYVLNGRKHFISHAPVSKLLLVIARTDKTVGTSIATRDFLVPRDTPGLTFGQVHDKVGFRIYLQGEITFGSSGVGSHYHLAAELLKSSAGIDMLHVPYKGTGPLVTALLSGEVMSAFAPIHAAFLPHIRSGRLRALGIVTGSRTSILPGLPTLEEELSLPGFSMDGWLGVVAPAGTPKTIVDRLSGEIARIVRDPQFSKEKLLAQSYEPLGSTPDQMGETMKAHFTKYAKIVRDAKIPAE